MRFFIIPLIFLIIPTFSSAEISCTSDLDGLQESELETILAQCEAEINHQKILLEDKQRDSVTIERDISILESKINKTKSEINYRNAQIKKLTSDISSSEVKIRSLEDESTRTKGSIADIVKKTYEIDSISTLEALLSGQTISNFFIDLDNFVILKKELSNSLQTALKLKDETEQTKLNLSTEKTKQVALKISVEEDQKKTLVYKDQKEDLLSLNKQQEDEYKKSIAEKEAIKNEVRNRIFRTVGGTELRFEDALKLIMPYSDVIGVEPALVLAVLTQESSVNGIIGANIGKCTYDQYAPNKSGTVMSDSQKSSFLDLMKTLGRNPSNTPVSCPIPQDGQYGGAMGPSQFMPNTWWDIKNETGYKKRVAKVLNISDPDPFKPLDAFTGTALYLSDARSLCAGPKGFSDKFDIYACTSAKYYSGLYNKGSSLYQHMTPTWSYGYKVATRAFAFQKDIDLLEL